ncbi:MAG: hypothetical protein IPH80_31195 [Myxococcales bacterium]|nr:hypothetical protein [Myxococcales bacterium]MBP6844696.1 hypothetical protein [Kofleriaceae bacterium]
MRAEVLGVALAAVALGCEARPAAAPPRPGADGLVAALGPAVGDRARGARALAGMAVPGPAWPRLVSAPYAGQHAPYARAYPVATAGLVDALAGDGVLAVRPHYADDPRLAPAQRRERIAVPVAAPGWIVSVDGRDLPAAFVWDGAAWRALAGIDALTRDAIGAHDHDCAVAYAAAADGRCLDASGPAAVAALAGDLAALAVACRRLIALADAGACGARGSVAPLARP